ncbi:MAG: type IV secretion system protein, partial [Bacteroidota bacterium]
MKHTPFSLSLLILSLAISNSFAQGIPVIDIAHIAMTVANGATLDDQLEKQEEQLEVSFQIEQKVKDIYQLQEDYQDFLKQARSVRNLHWADLVQSQAHALSLETHMDAYVPAYENIGTLKQAYTTLEGIGGALSLYQELDGFGADSPLPASVMALQQQL